MTYYALTVQQPFASLLIKGIKLYETRTWMVPSRLIGETIAIHAAKRGKMIRMVGERGLVRPDCGLPKDILERLPAFPVLGEVLGLVKVVGCLKITPELLAKISPEELAIGYWEISHYAWRLKVEKDFTDQNELVLFDTSAKGQQGLWKWNRKEE